MDENHQNVARNNPRAADNKLWTPPLSAKDRKKLDHLQKKSFAQRMGFAGKTPWDFIQLLLIPLVVAGVGYWFSFTQRRNTISIDLKGADLSGTDLRNVDLHGVDLSETDLSGAMITETQLKEVASLKGAIMPDGPKHP